LSHHQASKVTLAPKIHPASTSLGQCTPSSGRVAPITSEAVTAAATAGFRQLGGATNSASARKVAMLLLA
jgi:hypothetical protein